MVVVRGGGGCHCRRNNSIMTLLVLARFDSRTGKINSEHENDLLCLFE